MPSSPIKVSAHLASRTGRTRKVKSVNEIYKQPDRHVQLLVKKLTNTVSPSPKATSASDNVNEDVSEAQFLKFNNMCSIISMWKGDLIII